jgi:hypothetical protein
VRLSSLPPPLLIPFLSRSLVFLVVELRWLGVVLIPSPACFTVDVASVGSHRTGIAWLFWFFCILGCRYSAFGSSSPCTRLTGASPSCSSPPLPLVPLQVAATRLSGASGRHAPFRSEWPPRAVRSEWPPRAVP